MRFAQPATEIGENLWEADALGRKAQAESFVQVLKDINPPATVTVEADYGQGKSFFLNRVAKLLSGHGEVVRLNAWTDNPFGEPGAAIAGALIDHLEKKGDDQLPGMLDELIRNILAVSPNFALKGAASWSGIQGEGSLGKRKDIWKPLRPSAVEETREKVRFEIRQLHAALNPDNPPRIYFIIDDLDRCRPDQLVQFLENVRHIFSLENWVFIFAVAPEALEGSVKGQFGVESVDAFLRRFIELRFQLKRPRLLTYATHLLQENGYLSFGVPEFTSSVHLGLVMASQSWNTAKRANLRDLDKAMPPLLYLLEATKNDKTILRPLLLSLYFYRFFHAVEYQADPLGIARCADTGAKFKQADAEPELAGLYADLIAGGKKRCEQLLGELNSQSNRDQTFYRLILEGADEWWRRQDDGSARGQVLSIDHRLVIENILG